MAASDGIIVYGTRVYSSSDGVTYTEYSDCKEIETPAPEAPEVDFTPMADATGEARQFRLGLSKSGEFMFKQFYKKARVTTFISHYRTLRYWKIVFPDNATPASASNITFQGWLRRYKPPGATNQDDPAVIEATVLVTGAVTFTEGS